ncbi:MAG: hypothetical protein IPK19_41960 [Chloroflexi bacterium]|nr:hypothetical protein [Chloroflexota bacterium]
MNPLLSRPWGEGAQGEVTFLLLAVAWALQIFSGHTQTVFISGVALGLYALCTRPVRGLLTLAAAGVAAVLLALPQLIPTLELASLSNRSGGFNVNQATAFSFSPFVTGRGLLPSYDRMIFSEYIAYPGILMLALAWVGGVWETSPEPHPHSLRSSPPLRTERGLGGEVTDAGEVRTGQALSLRFRAEQATAALERSDQHADGSPSPRVRGRGSEVGAVDNAGPVPTPPDFREPIDALDRAGGGWPVPGLRAVQPDLSGAGRSAGLQSVPCAGALAGVVLPGRGHAVGAGRGSPAAIRCRVEMARCAPAPCGRLRRRHRRADGLAPLAASTPDQTPTYPPELITWAGWGVALALGMVIVLIAGSERPRNSAPLQYEGVGTLLRVRRLSGLHPGNGILLLAAVLELLLASGALAYNQLVPPDAFRHSASVSAR